MQVMNERLLNYPIPPSVVEPVHLAAAPGSDLSRAGAGPRNRYAKASEFAHDLEHLAEVGVEDRPELHEWQKRKSHSLRKFLYYGALALIPVVMLLVMVLLSRRH